MGHIESHGDSSHAAYPARDRGTIAGQKAPHIGHFKIIPVFLTNFPVLGKWKGISVEGWELIDLSGLSLFGGFFSLQN